MPVPADPIPGFTGKNGDAALERPVSPALSSINMHGTPPTLDPVLCRIRQQRLRTYLSDNNLDGALFFDRHYVYALTGYWHAQPLTPTAMLLRTDGKTDIFVHSEDPDAPAADAAHQWTPNYLFTLRENLPSCLAESLNPQLVGLGRIGVDHQTPSALVHGPECIDITMDYQHIRRCKDDDEVEALEFTMACADQVYAEAKRVIEPGVTEVSVMSAMLKKAVDAAGEMLSGWGQDFKSGAPGGFAERRAIEAGEIYVLDVGVGVRGYRCDLCRAFAVDGNPTEAQAAAHEKIVSVMAMGEQYLKPGESCKAMFEAVEKELDGWMGYSFFHHAGHGIGLDAHEVPRINPKWDDTFQENDVIAFEPGLYGDELRAGIRLENNYLITSQGCRKLSGFPLDLV